MSLSIIALLEVKYLFRSLLIKLWGVDTGSWEMNLSLSAYVPSAKVQTFRRRGLDQTRSSFVDQCDREFHVKCLKEHGICDLSKVPDGKHELLPLQGF